MNPRRLPNLDRLRLIASFGIVYFHVTQRMIFFAASLIVFLVTTVAFGVRNDRMPAFRPYLWRRLVRLGLPWLFWSAVYAGYMAYRGTLAGDLRPWMLLTGTWYHLWFLPYILFATCAAYGIHLLLHKLPRRRAAHIALAATCVMALIFRKTHERIPYPQAVWSLSLPALPLGYAFGRLLGIEPELRSRIAQRILVIALLIAPWFFFRHPLGLPSRYAFATAFLAIPLAWPGRPDRFTAWATDLRYGVYCVHPLIALWVLWPNERWSRSLLVYAVCLAVIAPLRRTFLRACC